MEIILITHQVFYYAFHRTILKLLIQGCVHLRNDEQFLDLLTFVWLIGSTNHSNEHVIPTKWYLKLIDFKLLSFRSRQLILSIN